MFDKDHIKENLSIEQVAEVLADLGGHPKLQGKIILTDTICHNLPGEGSQKLYYYDNTKLFKCYTGCHEYFDIFQLVQKVFDVQYNEEWSLPKAVSYIAQKFGFSPMQEESFVSTLEDWSIFKNYERILLKEGKDGAKISLKEYDDGVLKRLPSVIIKPWIDEGITRDTLDFYEIGYYPKDCQIVIPHRDDNGILVGIRGRTLIQEEGEIYGKYRPIKINGYMYNHPLGFALYGLDKTKNNISMVRKAIIFEGEKSVLLYDSYFGKENNISVACCGSSLSSHQFELLLKLGVTEIIIAFDKQFKEIGDDEFKMHTRLLNQISTKYGSFVTVSFLHDKSNLLGYKDSPIDKGRETFIELFKNRITLRG